MSAEVTSYLRQHQKTIEPLHKDYSLRFWDLSLAGNNREFEKALVESKERYLKVYNNREEFRQLREWNTSVAEYALVRARAASTLPA